MRFVIRKNFSSPATTFHRTSTPPPRVYARMLSSILATPPPRGVEFTCHTTRPVSTRRASVIASSTSL
jgi:hypothetical protein